MRRHWVVNATTVLAWGAVALLAADLIDFRTALEIILGGGVVAIAVLTLKAKK